MAQPLNDDTMADPAAIKVRSNTGVPDSFLHRDLLVCCGEDRREMLHAVQAVMPGDVPSYRYRCYEFWRYPSFTLVLTGIGTGCLEPLLWEVMDAKTLGDKAAQRLVLFGTAGYLSDDKFGCGQVFLVDGAYPAGCAVRLDSADLPVRPRFHGLDRLPNPRAEEISTDHYYAFSPSTDPRKMIAKNYDKSLQEGVTTQWKNGRLIAMETGQFYHFCRCYGDDHTQFAAFRGVANLADQFEQQGDNAVNVLRESFRQAVQLLSVGGTSASNTITVHFINKTNETVSFYLNGGTGLTTSLASKGSQQFNVVVDPGVQPLVGIHQPNGESLYFTLTNNGNYGFEVQGGKIVNAYNT